MQVVETELPGVLIIEPVVFGDERGSFCETYHQPRYAAAGIDVTFVQDNSSSSREGVLRGLHYQVTRAQAKLLRAVRGALWDVAVDLRRGSPTFGRWVGVELSADNRRQLFIPAGCAHGFCVLATDASGFAEIAYKCSAVYAPEDEAGVRWDDPELAIEWPVAEPVLSERDAALPLLADATLPELGS